MRAVQALVLTACLLAPSVVPAQTVTAPDAATQDELGSIRSALEQQSVTAFDPASMAVLAQLSSRALAYAEHGGSSREVALALFYAADSLDRQMRFAEALARYRESLERDPSGPYGGRAMARINSLQSDAVDDFAALRMLERFRREHNRAAATVSEAQAFVTQATALRASPARAQALLLGARALHEGHATDSAVRVLQSLAQNPETSLDDRAMAMHQIAMMREENQDFSRAGRELTTLRGDPREVARMQRLARRQTLRKVMRVIVSVQYMLGVICVLLTAKQKRFAILLSEWRRPLPWMHLSVLTFGGAMLTRSYDNHEIGHVWALGVGSLLAYLSATAMSVSLGKLQRFRTVLRVGAVLLSAIAVLGVSFLAMDRFDNGMLDGIAL